MSSYGPKGTAAGAQYNQTDNLDRKATRTGEEHDGIGPNKASRVYTSAAMGTAKAQAAREAKADLARNKKQPVTEYRGADAAKLNIAPPKPKVKVTFAKNGQWDLDEK